MKKAIQKKVVSIFIPILLMLGMAVGFPIRAMAAGISVSVSSDTVNIGDSVTVYITLSGTEIYGATGNIDFDGILSGEAGGFVADGVGEDTITFSRTFQAVEEGTGAIYVSGEVSDGETKDSAGEAVVYITVLGNDNGGGGTGGNAGGNGNEVPDDSEIPTEDPGNINGNEEPIGSDNTNLAILEVEGVQLTDEGHDIYSGSVSNSVKTINLIATPEDINAYVYGTGEYELHEGENSFDITVVAENGYSRAYTVKITRRGDKFYLTDLKEELAATKEESFTVTLRDNDKLTQDIIEAISKWGKTLHLNRYDANGKFVYGWTFDGKALAEEKNFKEFDPTVTFESDQMSKINALADNAKGKILNFAFSGDLPKNTTFTLPIDKDFAKGDTLFLYYYDEKENTLKREGREIDVNEEQITLELSHCSLFFLTKTFIQPKTDEQTDKPNTMLYIIIGIAVIVVAVLLVVFLLLRRKRLEQQAPKSREEISRHFERYDDLDDEEEYEKTDFWE